MRTETNAFLPVGRFEEKLPTLLACIADRRTTFRRFPGDPFHKAAAAPERDSTSHVHAVQMASRLQRSNVLELALFQLSE
jgi:hypothetical protein